MIELVYLSAKATGIRPPIDIWPAGRSLAPSAEKQAASS